MNLKTETFKCIVVSQSENSVRIKAYGKTESIGRSVIERLKIVGDRADITIPYWLFKKLFES